MTSSRTSSCSWYCISLRPIPGCCTRVSRRRSNERSSARWRRSQRSGRRRPSICWPSCDRWPMEQPDPPGSPPPSPHLSTEALLARIRGGDTDARETLLARYVTGLRRWAHGRLPTAARDLVDTDDLVQSTLYRALAHVEEFDNRGEGAF